jgi:alpha-tubulin suppressor-like RCC1 family protein
LGHRTVVASTIAVLILMVLAMSIQPSTIRAVPSSPKQLWTWGENGNGQLGSGTTRNTPAIVNERFAQTIDVAAGFFHTLALHDDQTVWAWGGNRCGQLGDGTQDDSNTPVQVRDLDSVLQVATASSATASMALKQDSTVWEWGITYFNNLATCILTPSQVVADENGAPFTGVQRIAVGAEHKLALKQDGTVWAWGNNGSGQLGNGEIDPSTAPVQVRTLSNIVAISAGGYHNLALKQDGTVWAWGLGSLGQRGDGTGTLVRKTPVQVVGPGGQGFLNDVVAIAAGQEHSLAIRGDGTVWAWGDNAWGELGNSDASSSFNLTPLQVQSPSMNGALSGVVRIAAGNDHSLAVKEDGTVLGWGKNANGELGDGTNNSGPTPRQTKTICDAVAIAAGNRHSVAVASSDCGSTVHLPLIHR